MLRALLDRLLGKPDTSLPVLPEPTGVDWPGDWQPIRDPSYAQALAAELARTASRGHVLCREKGPIGAWRAVATGLHSDDVLFARADEGSAKATGLWAEVHLTWRKEKDPAWPATTVYESWAAWAADTDEADPCD